LAAAKPFSKLARATSTWDPITRPVNSVLFGGRRTPGIADVEGIDEKYKSDMRWGMGMSGANSVVVGRPPIAFKILIRLYSVAHWVGWNEFRVFIQPEIVARGIPGAIARTRCFDIVHPFTAEARIQVVKIDSISQPKLTREDGEWTVEIGVTEWRMPKDSYAKPDAPASPEPVDPREQKMKELTAEHQRNELAIAERQKRHL
jgi:hypothetical protein